MGLFGKKKTPTAKSGTGDYVAPPTVAETPAEQPAQVTTADVEEDLIQIDNVTAPTSPFAMAGKNSSTITEKNANLGGDDVEEGVASQEGATMDATANTDDEPTVFSERTDQTNYTYPTLKSVGSEDSKDSAFTITRNGQYLTLNGFANGHLMRWKFAAEEGPALVRIPAVFVALGVICTTVYPIVTIQDFWTIPILICAVHTCVLASLILVLEGRVVGVRSPTNCRGRLRGVLTRYMNLFRLLWGRGLLYIFVGSMNLTIDFDKVVYSAFPIIGLGLIAICSGAHASFNLDKMKTSLTDESYLWSKFDANDPDKDNFIDINGFAELLWALGLEFDDVYTYKAFTQIDSDSDAKVSFEEFKDWWIVTQNDGRKLKSRD
jgi:hypothetical protein